MSGKTQEHANANVAIIDLSTKEQIDRATLLRLLKAHRVNTSPAVESVPLEEIIPTLKKAKVNIPESFFRDLAAAAGFPFLEFSKIKRLYANEQKSLLITFLPYSVVTKYRVIPSEITESYVEVVVDNPLNDEVVFLIQCIFEHCIIRINVASSKAIEWAVDNIYRQIHKQKAMFDLYNRTPDQSAFKVLFPNQKYFIVALLAIIVVSAILSSAVTLVVLFALVTVGYFIGNPIKIYVSLRGFREARTPNQVTETEMSRIPDERLPVYTILVPVFHESAVLSQNLKNMYNLGYPKEKLDIKILMEEKDEETISEARMLGLFGGSPKKYVEGIPKGEYTEFLKLFDPVIVPTSEITTKPRACNYGLLQAKGELCVIYDAEDEPDADQLKKAAIVFLQSNENVVCLQSKLNFYNANENILTRWFSIEYASWFDFYLEGLDYINAPIPLGGTSNHFRKKSLDELGRWDPYNVTEDADIGIRLARQKLKTEMIESYTCEEATTTVKSWIRQRSRWYKGHLQTYLVHMRSPRKLRKNLGTEQFVKFQLTFGTNIFMPIVNPILWALTAVSLVTPLFFVGLIPSYVLWLCLFNLVLGNLSYLSIYVIACVKLQKYRLTPLALLMPLYWALLSIASWRGLIQLLSKPFYWDKTTHGVTKFAKTTM